MKNWVRLKQNPERWEIYKIRMQVIKVIREFFWNKNFLEVETPLMVSSLILESSLDHFQTELVSYKGAKKKMFLTTSPEASLKKLLSVGSGNVFEITKSFRNRETDIEYHNSEFTILEWYEVGKTYKEVMETCETLLRFIIDQVVIKRQKAKGKRQKAINSLRFCVDDKKPLRYKNQKINIFSPWKRISVLEAWEKYTGTRYEEIYDKKTNSYPLEKLITVCKMLGFKVNNNNSWEELFNQVFLNLIEPKLCQDYQPFFLYDYPTPLAQLAKIKRNDPRFAERFELYIGGLEMADCYQELTDFKEQEKRFAQEEKLIKNQGKKDFVPDLDYLKALKMGMPECSGIALGIDRLVMLFTDSKSIEDVILFPNGQL